MSDHPDHDGCIVTAIPVAMLIAAATIAAGLTFGWIAAALTYIALGLAALAVVIRRVTK